MPDVEVEKVQLVCAESSTSPRHVYEDNSTTQQLFSRRTVHLLFIQSSFNPPPSLLAKTSHFSYAERDPTVPHPNVFPPSQTSVPNHIFSLYQTPSHNHATLHTGPANPPPHHTIHQLKSKANKAIVNFQPISYTQARTTRSTVHFKY